MIILKAIAILSLLALLIFLGIVLKVWHEKMW
jgi:hypothetical protein